MMFKSCLIVLFLVCANGTLLPNILEMIHYFFSDFPPSSKTLGPKYGVANYILPFDFVVIGAGTAGSVLVNRLTENPNWRVLVLEQGNDETFLTDIPFLAPILYATNYARVYKSEMRPQNAHGHGGCCLSMVNGRCNIMSGKAVGGTSVVNYMIYSRGSPIDYDIWRALDNPGWSYEEVLPYFIKSERCMLIDKEARYHGYDGYLDVTNSPFSSLLKKHWLKAGQELGYNLVDYNSDRVIGFSSPQANLRNGYRVSANKAFLEPIRNRTNFYLSKFSTVTKIVINPRSKKAVGVEFIKNHRTYFIPVYKEIILSAGALSSPQLLMLSGVGPKDHLSSLGIRVIESLPVGFNLQDHVTMAALTFLVNQSVNAVQHLASNFLEYMIQGIGPLTLPGRTEALAFFNTKVNLKNVRESHDWTSVNHDINETCPNRSRSLTEDDYPDIELLLTSNSLATDTFGLFRNLLGLTDDFYKEILSDLKGFNDAFTILPVLLRPKSHGRLTLRSTNPLDSPIIDINYYDHEDDINTMVRGIKMAIKVASTKAFKPFGTTLLPVPFPGCKHIAFKSDPYWACVARHVSTTIAHFAGTCKMSTRRNSGVVDHRLRVHGISGLRVVDASIMPTIIAGHTTAPVYMIAEKASDMIKEDWKDSTP